MTLEEHYELMWKVYTSTQERYPIRMSKYKLKFVNARLNQMFPAERDVRMRKNINILLELIISKS